MAKKARTKQTSANRTSQPKEQNLPVSKQTAGGITGAVLGGIVAGPVGAIAGGVAGAIVGDSSAKGKKPMKVAAETIRSEVKKGRVIKALKSVTGKIKASVSKNSKTKSTAKKTATKSLGTVRKTGSKASIKPSTVAKKSKASTARTSKKSKKRSKKSR
jgi:hypothetical protein